jgi:alcohol dehydrogenase class IV
MIPFSLEMPRVVHFGAGALGRLPETARELGPRVLLLTGRNWFQGSPWAASVSRALSGFSVESYRCPSAEPSVRSVDEAAQAASAFQPDVIVAVGGGSVLDTAKAVSALARHPGSAERFLEGFAGSVPVPGPCLPWIAVPTTAGTGAEATKNAVIKSDAAGVKRSMRSRHLLAHAVLVDPELTLSLPAEVTGTSGLDAFTQLVESYLSRSATPPVRSLVQGAFAGMWEALEGLSGAPGDLALREKASYGSFISGVALANAGLGAAHGFAAAVGGAYDVPHGLACAVFLPHVLEANREVIRNDLAGLLGASLGPRAAEDPVGWLGSGASRFLRAYGLPTDLRRFSIPREKAGELAEKASGSSMRGNPRELSIEERTQILLRVL